MTSGWRDAVATLGGKADARYDELKRALEAKLGSSEPVQILPYRGYGTRETFRVRGRVVEDYEVAEPEDRDSVWKNMLRMFERYRSEEIAGARVRASYRGQEREPTTDDEGYFDVVFDTGDPGGERWLDVEFTLLEPRREGQGRVEAATEAIVPPASADFAVVSDIDDTIVRTGATNLLRHARTIFLNNAETRLPFPGVAAFYRALERGSTGESGNPIFYISSSPWNLYDLFESFMRLHDIPVGPIMLKDFGVDEDKFIKTGHLAHKLEHIRGLMDLYPDLRFLLIGDSGQKDAEIYRRIVEERADRVLAVYIRDVSPEDRDRTVKEIGEQIRAAGVEMVYAEETLSLAQHSVERGWIGEAELPEIREAKGADESKPSALERLLGGP